MKAKELCEVEQSDDSSLFLNRDLSMLEFNRRVLELACDPGLPVLERLRFLSISSTNMDEFFEVRVALQKQRMALGSIRTSPDGLTASEILTRVRETVTQFVADQYQFLNRSLLPDLQAADICFPRRSEWNAAQKEWVRKFFRRELLPVLTPIGLDPAHPFPRSLNKVLNFIVALKGKDAFGRESKYAIVQAPRSVSRMIRMPAEIANCEYCYVFLSSIIHAYVDDFFPGMKVKACHQFRLTRSNELFVDEEEVVDLKKAVAGELLERRFSAPVRLEVSSTCPPELSNFLAQHFGLLESDLYCVDGPVNLHRMAGIYDEVDRPDLKFPGFEQGAPQQLQVDELDMFKEVGKGDVLLHHPFQSFNPVVELLNQAAADPNVLVIKQTMYRVVPDSPIVDALIRAARANKEVVAVIELRARFNEQENIIMADRLSAAGAQVVYGVVGYKTHGKMMLIVRREGKKLNRYVHLGTGNYHTITSRYYTDFGLLSCNPKLGEDVHKLFQQLTGLGKVTELKEMLSGPFTLKDGLLMRINREADLARQGGKGIIKAKINGLEEPEIISALYNASQAGVKIDLVVRGICCLRPGIKGVSENIQVRSVLGRFLEHTRVYYFYNGGEAEVFGASADWMTRNLVHRMETCFPLRNSKLAGEALRQGLELYLSCNANTWRLCSHGGYERLPADSDEKDAQQLLMEELGTVGGC